MQQEMDGSAAARHGRVRPRLWSRVPGPGLALGLVLGLAFGGTAAWADPSAMVPAGPSAAVDTTLPGELGFSVGLDALRWQGALDLTDEFADYRQLGAGWLRVDLNWSVVQAAGPDSFDWTSLDRILVLADRAGMKLLPVAGSAPDWLDGGRGPSTPEAFAAYADFLSAAVHRYSPRIRAWEIWNEPNLSSFWPPAPDQTAYAQLLRAAHAAIKAADPTALVLFGGLSPVPDIPPEESQARRLVPAVRFLADVYAAGGAGTFDALSFHPYTWPELPDSPNPWSGWTIMAGPIRDLMTAHGDAGKKVWITEFGAPTNPGGVTEATQAEILRRGVERARATPWAGPVLWYSYRDLGTDPEDSEDWYGLVRHTRDPKPAYPVFRDLAKTRP